MRDDDLLLFHPVPLQRRRANGWTPEVQRAFVAALARYGLISIAARSVGRTAHSAYALRRRSGAEEFIAAWDLALEIGQGTARDALVQAGFEPRRVPVIWHGAIIGWREIFNDRLAIAAMRALYNSLPLRKARPPRPIALPSPEPLPPGPRVTAL